jgi:hypothetical protein
MGVISNTTITDSGQTVVTEPANWSVVHEPATATKATVTKAAGGAGVRHVCTGVQGSIACDSTPQSPLRLQLKDGATTVASWSVAATANGMGGVALDGLCIMGTANTALTLEFSSAGVAGSSETVTLFGFSVT